MDIGDGNTISSPNNKKKKELRHKSYCFTLNNYNGQDMSIFINYFKKMDCKWIIGREIGELNNTIHLQGYVFREKRLRFNNLKKLNNKIHIEVARGTICENYRYCSKGNDFETNIDYEFELMNETGLIEYNRKILLDYYKQFELYDWQKFLLNELDKIEKIEMNRLIYVITDSVGAKGKSFIKNQLFLSKHCCLIGGKKSDTCFNILTKMEMDKINPKLYIDDISRLDNLKENIYEDILGRIIFSSKYTSKSLVLHKDLNILIFTNIVDPLRYKMSKDRYRFLSLDSNELKWMDYNEYLDWWKNCKDMFGPDCFSDSDEDNYL